MIPFAKLHACGNDFLIVEEKHVPSRLQADLAKRLCERNTGVGADGVEYFAWTGDLAGTIHLRNADGSIAEISGNGTRCVAAWMARQRMGAEGTRLHIKTDAGTRECRVISAQGSRYEIESGMGVPVWRPSEIRLNSGTIVQGTQVNTGNPHFVIFVNDFVDGTWQRIGDEVCHHPDFPGQTNVEFVRVVSPERIEIRIYERGVGPTHSSGTGTCASATAAIALRGSKPMLMVEAPGGTQQVEWLGAGAEMLLTGPAVMIAEGMASMEAAQS